MAALVALRAASARADQPRPADLRYDARIDIAVTSIGATWFFTSELLKGRLVPETYR